MESVLSPKQRMLDAQAKEVRRMEQKAKKLSVAVRAAQQVMSLLFALQLCLVNMYIMVYVCDEVVRNVLLLEAASVQKLVTFFGTLLSADWLAIVLYAILFIFGVPILGGVLTKWIVYLVVTPKLSTDIMKPTYSGLQESTKKISNLLRELPEGTLGARYLWMIPFYVLSAIPFVKALLNSGMGSGYVTEEILGIIVWAALVYLALWLLGMLLKFPANVVVSDGNLRSVVGKMQTQLEKQTPSSQPAPKPAKSSKPTSKPAKSPKPTSKPAADTPSVIKHDSFTWTAAYVREHEHECSEMAISSLNVAKEFLEEGNMAAAFNAFAHVVRGLELLKECDKEYYLPPLYANAFAASKVAAFGTKNMADAEKYAKLAVQYAQAGAAFSDVARRDSDVISDYLSEVRAQGSDLWDVFGEAFPYDIING